MRKRNAVALIGGICAVAILGTTIFFVLNRDNNESSHDNETSYACSDTAFTDRFIGEELYTSVNSQKLAEFVQEVKGYTDYDKSPNCMYALTMHAINTGDHSAAQESYDKLKTAYDAAKGYVGSLAQVSVRVPDELKDSVDFLAKQAENLEKGKLNWGAPVER